MKIHRNPLTYSFVTIAAFPKPFLHEFVVSSIRSCPNPEQLATMVLRNIYSAWSFRTFFNPPSVAKCIVESFLSLGADINSKGVLVPPRPERNGGFVAYISPLSSFMKEAVVCNDFDGGYMAGLLNLFLSNQPIINHRISLALTVHRGNGDLYSVRIESDITLDCGLMVNPNLGFHFFWRQPFFSCCEFSPNVLAHPTTIEYNKFELTEKGWNMHGFFLSPVDHAPRGASKTAASNIA